LTAKWEGHDDENEMLGIAMDIKSGGNGATWVVIEVNL